MTHTEFVKQFESKLGTNLKLAADLASLLDNEHLQAGVDCYGLLQLRTETFNRFCALFVHAGLQPPPMEEALWRVSLPKPDDSDSAKAAKTHALQIKQSGLSRLSGKKGPAASRAQALLAVLEMFPSMDEFGNHISQANLLAALNRLLVDELKLPPLRPDYSAMPCPKPCGINPPKTPVKVLIVDDSRVELFKSALAMAGIERLEIGLYRYLGKDSWKKLSGDEKENCLQRTATALLALNPELVLMDQGLGDIDGSDLVQFMFQRKRPDERLFFVANTGGEPEPLISAGCWGNFNKGQDLRPLAELFRYYF